ncbi:dimethylsulfoniopropionate lyase [Mesorhizobium muleiense]|uniref:Cupin domain protein n=1 Tax=Mesorhizobium muleiense TaxID=1004279 RepID=A0A1G9KR60_9HYPH|nr:dimethylsulfoniopropionate lyase [Mesorhizobium muleiense]MCF6098883.1 dimethylsulfoniopropionate lyase [Mesorhizobium muleiense]SDL52149.1 Cupin domain protein [Mesorhizobium muleiense]
MNRSGALQYFVDTAFVAFDQFSHDLRSRRSIIQLFAQSEVPGPEKIRAGSRLPVCSYLGPALAEEAIPSTLRNLIERFKAIEPLLEWRLKSNPAPSASSNFRDGHANAMILGPGGLEDRNDLWLGVTLMAPHVRYPDHDHPPEETYLVLSHGEFKHGDKDWFSPGIGGSFYNPPGIKHAMRSLDRPLFAFWALLVDQTHH